MYNKLWFLQHHVHHIVNGEFLEHDKDVVKHRNVNAHACNSLLYFAVFYALSMVFIYCNLLAMLAYTELPVGRGQSMMVGDHPQ